MQLIAHRGLTSKNIKENTIEAFTNALNNGYSGIELDIRITKDKQIVVIHDKMINRTSNGKGNINNITYKELLKYSFGSKKIKSKIPLLKDVIKKINNSIIIIELKEKIEKKDLEKILSKNTTNEYYLCSFNKTFIDNIKDIKYKKGIINNIFNSYVDIRNYDFILILETLFKEDIYNNLNKKNIEPIIYNIHNNLNIKNKDLINKLKYII